MSKRTCVRSEVKEEVRHVIWANRICASPRTPGFAQMMSTARRVGMWKCDVHRVPPSNEADLSRAILGAMSRSDLRPRKNILSSWHACAMWWNCPAVHGVWKSATADNPTICKVGRCTSTYSSDAFRLVCCRKKSCVIHVLPSRVHSESRSASCSPRDHSSLWPVSSFNASLVITSYSR